MKTKQEEFLLAVRRAVRLEEKPTLTSDAELVQSEAKMRALERAKQWLTPKTVQAYEDSEFSALPEHLRTQLRDAVDRFRVAASAAPPASIYQLEVGLDAFGRLRSAVREVVLSEWRTAVETLLGTVENWSHECGWRTRRESKAISETLLGKYSMPQLLLYAEQHLYCLDPLARFVVGASGTIELSLQPSFQMTSIFRDLDGAWLIELTHQNRPNGANSTPFGKESFLGALGDLRSSV